ncbi:MAG: lectin-like protein [Bacteroidota bacterium]
MKKKLLLTVLLGITFNLFAAKNPASTVDTSISIVELLPPSITSQPEGGTIYVGESIDISITATDYTIIQWESSINNGSSWNTISDNATFSGSSTTTLTFTPDSELTTGILLRAILTDASNDTLISSEALVIVANYTQIPDPNFEARLEALGYDDISGDGQVPTSLIRNVTSLNVDAQNISDLTGIEAFTRLDELRADNNNLTNPDFSQNKVLRRLFLRNNNITVFDLTANTNIQRLLVEGNGMTDLNLTGVTNLDNLFAAGNNLTEIDLSTNIRLKVVGLGTNNLSRVDIRNGNNTNITIMQLTNNPNLYCVEVDDAAYSTTNWTNIDAQTGFSEVDCYVSIPDANFEAALHTLGYDDISGDGQVPVSLIETVTSLSIGSSGISDLTGIANFTALETLLANNNSISTADLSSNANLITVSLRNNGLTSLDVTGSPNLGLILVETNNLTSIDVTNNPLLTRLWAQNNSLNALDVSNNTILRAIGATNSNLSSLDVSNIPTLEQLYVEGNNLTELDVSNNPALVILGASSNNLSSLNMQNGNNTNVTNFTAGNNPNLNCIFVDDVAYSATNWTNIDAQTSFSETYCRYTQIPDLAFEDALAAYDDVAGDGQVPTELIEGITSLDVGSEGINDMTGIEDFVALQTLTAGDNQFSSINLSTLTQLTELNLQGSDVSSIDVSSNTLLTILNLEETQLTTVDVSANELLEELDLKDIGMLTSITFGNNTALRILDASFNDITSLDLSALTALEQILVNSNELTALNIKNGNNTSITTFNASSNANLSCIFVDDVAYATTNFTNIDATTTFSDTDYCRYTAIPDANFEARLEALGYDDIASDGQVPTALIEVVTDLNITSQSIADLTGIEDFTSLENLNARFNALSSINLSANLNLIVVNLANNNLTNIDLSSNANLEQLNLSNNTNLPSLDISANTSIFQLTIDGTSALTTINFGTNPFMTTLSARNSGFTSLDLSPLPNLVVLNLNNSLLTTLDLSANGSLREVYLNSTTIENLNLQNGNNADIFVINLQNNPNLFCVLVDDIVFTNDWTLVDAQTSFSDTFCRYTQIPDATFEAQLEALGYDDISGDGQVPTELIEVVTTLDVGGNNIADFSGIEDFVALTSLNVANNSAITLDISNLTALQILHTDANNLTSLDVSNNTDLVELYCSFNSGISAIDISNNTLLEIAHISQNSISTMDVSNNTLLTELRLRNNNLTSLDITNNTALEFLYIDGNSGITSLDVTANTALLYLNANDCGLTTITGYEATALQFLYLANNNLTSLDLSNNGLLEIIDIRNNQLINLNIKNGNNTAIGTLLVIDNPDLNCILVDDVAYSNTNWNFIDAQTSFSDTFCRYTSIPDTNFEAALEALGYDDISADGQVPTALIESITSLNISNQNIGDFTGIQEFTAMRQLYVSNNVMSSIEVSAMTDLLVLEMIGCTNVASLDVSANTALLLLSIENNTALTSLDISTNVQLEALYANGASLSTLITGANTLLGEIEVSNNDLTELDLSNLPALYSVDVSQNDLTSFDIRNGNNNNLTDFNALGNNNLECMFVDDATAFLNAWSSRIESNTTLSETYCRYTAIPDTTFEAVLEGLGYDDISGDGQVPTALIENITLLNVSDNGISDLTGIEDFVALETLYAGDNLVTALDVSNLTELKSLRVAYNQLTSLDLSLNTQLEDLNVSFNNLSTLNIRNSNNSDISQFSTVNNPNLTCILVDNIAFAVANFTNIDPQTSFSETFCLYTAIPDANFEARLEALGYDDISGDGQVPTELIETVTTLGLTNLNISDATGIQDFTALRTLRINTNNLTAIDVTNNINLETLYLSSNNLTAVDLTNNINLETLYLHDNELATVDLSMLVVLEDLRIYNNPLTSLDVSTNTLLTSIDAADTNLETISLSNNTLLEDVQLYDCAALTTVDVSGLALLRNLYLNDTNVEALDLSSNTALSYLGIDGNTAITSLDLTNNNAISSLDTDDCTALSSITFGSNTGLGRVDLTNTALTSLDVSSLTNLRELTIQNTFIETLDLSTNQALEELDASNANLNLLFIQNGNNTNIVSFDTTNNPNLTCILVDNATYSTTNWTNIDNQTNFSDIFCRYTAIPDPTFEAVLESLGYDDMSADGQVPTPLIEVVTSLDLTLLNIQDITGIQDFIALESLVLAYTNVVDVDVSSLQNLQTLNVSNTSTLTSLNVSGATALNDLQVYNNPSLTGTLDVSPNLNLQILNIYNTGISALDIRNGNNTAIMVFDATGNANLNCILVDDAAFSTTNWTQIDAGTTFNEFDCIVPEIACPADITVDNEAGICGGNITIPLPVITDNVVCIQSDDLEAYSEGLLLGQGGDWDTWNPNTISESGNITTEQARSGSKSLKIEGVPDGGPQDMAFNLGNRDFGAYELTYHLYVPAGNTAYSNMQKTENAGQEYASQLFFRSDGTGRYDNSGPTVDFNYPQDTWFEMKVLINIDADYSEVFVDGTLISSHPFSDTTGSSGGLNTLGSVTFYPLTASSDVNTDATPLFYVDDLSLCAVAVNDMTNNTDASNFYPLGTTDVVWRYTDEGQNIATCTQTVTVNDVEAPEIVSCTEDIITCETTVNYEVPLVIDICETPTPENIEGFAYIGSYNNKLYYLSDDSIPVTEAFTNAEALNGFVATITSEEDLNWLRQAVTDAGQGTVLIGYREANVNGTFEWHSGSSATYTNWRTGQPDDNGASDNYVQMWGNGEWNDISSTSSRRYVIEISAFPMTQIAGLPSGSEFPIGTTTNIFEATDAAGNTVTCSFDVTVEAICNTDFSLELDVFLQGAALNPNTGEEELMRDDLRKGGFIPTRSPYSDMLTCDATVFDVSGNDAIVDWIWIELRDAADNTIVSYAQSALLQRDGDVVDIDGISPLDFSTTEDRYYVALHHRNHLGIMSTNAIMFTTGTTTNVNFKDNNETFGSNSQTDSGMSGVFGLWCGNVNQDLVIQYSGTSPDTPDILSEILNDAGNFLNFPTYSVTGYNAKDANMDGVIQYSGTNPDTPFILQNVLAHPGNFLNFSTFQIQEQLPENFNLLRNNF